MFIFIHLELLSKVFLEKDTTIGRTETGEPEILQIDRVKLLDCVGRLTWNSRLFFICTIQCNQLIIAILKCISCCYKANSFARH